MINELKKVIKKTIKTETKTNQTKKIIQVKAQTKVSIKLENLSS